MSDLRPEILTWSALLAQWMDFARASLSLPEEGEGGRWRGSVAPIVNFQAVTFALADLARIAGADRPLARDRAAVLIERSAGELQTIWAGQPWPETLAEICADARAALAAAAYVGAARRSARPGPTTRNTPRCSRRSASSVSWRKTRSRRWASVVGEYPLPSPIPAGQEYPREHHPVFVPAGSRHDRSSASPDLLSEVEVHDRGIAFAAPLIRLLSPYKSTIWHASQIVCHASPTPPTPCLTTPCLDQ